MFHVEIYAQSIEDLLNLTRFSLDLKESSAREKDNQFVIEGILSDKQIVLIHVIPQMSKEQNGLA